jgi:uncharacterized protein YjbI with pentapeptide repeats
MAHPSWWRTPVAEHFEFRQRLVSTWESLLVRGLVSGNWLTHLFGANPSRADLSGADLSDGDLSSVSRSWADAKLNGANLSGARAAGAFFNGANLSGANLSGARAAGAFFNGANLSGANLSGADLIFTNFATANLRGANLSGAHLICANLNRADLSGADLSGADLNSASLVGTNLANADLTGCRIYGISAWSVKLSEGTKQQDLVITAPGEPEVVIDNIEVAQFVYLLLHNEKIRDVIDTIGRKGVLLLGRFTEGRMAVLERLRDELRKRGYVPIVFNFDKPETKDFTETVRLLAGLSKFVITDLSGPKSTPYELGAIVSQTMIPFQPIITAGETPFAMLRDLLTSYPDRVFQPIEYPSVDRLIETMDAEIIGPAERRFDELVMRRAETLKVRRV